MAQKGHIIRKLTTIRGKRLSQNVTQARVNLRRIPEHRGPFIGEWANGEKVQIR